MRSGLASDRKEVEASKGLLSGEDIGLSVWTLFYASPLWVHSGKHISIDMMSTAVSRMVF